MRLERPVTAVILVLLSIGGFFVGSFLLEQYNSDSITGLQVSDVQEDTEQNAIFLTPELEAQEKKVALAHIEPAKEQKPKEPSSTDEVESIKDIEEKIDANIKKWSLRKKE